MSTFRISCMVMESRSLPEAIKSILQTYGWSQARLARELGVTPDWVSKAKRADRDPAFGWVIKMLAGIGWEVVIRPEREKADPVKRREFVTTAASVMFVPSPKVGPYEDPTHVRELTRRLSRARYEHGGGAIAATAMRHIRLIEPALADGDRKLQEAASELATETVWTLTDVRRFDIGENVGRLALELAKRSQSPDAQSRAYSALAAINLDRGSTDRALRYAAEGVQLHDVAPDQHVWMRLRKGRTLALMPGHEHASRDELESVQAEFWDRVSWGQYLFDVADMMGSIGIGLNGIGAYPEAHGLLGEAVSILDGSSPLLQSRFLAQQVIAAMGMSEPSIAADHMLVLARTAPMVNSRRLDGYLRQVLDASAKWATVPEVRTARDQLRGVTTP